MQPEKAFLPSGGFDESRLREPREAVASYLHAASLAQPLAETVALIESYGRVLAQDTVADRDYPDAPRSAMDGFAMRHGAQRYRLDGEVRMGSALGRGVAEGAAVRIPTGGVVPEGCDCIVPIEDARIEGDAVVLVERSEAGQHVIPAGTDMRAGEVVLPRGRRLRAADTAVLATLGCAQVPVLRRPRVAVVSSGDELIDVSAKPDAGQIRDSNRYAVAATLAAWGCDVRHVPTVSDEPGALEAVLRRLLPDCDAIVLTGGSSVGERDATPRAVATLGEPGIIVHGLRVKPGKPTVLGAINGVAIIGLPGNPSSALTILQAVAKPVFEHLTGAPLQSSTIDAELTGPLSSRPGWTWYIPVAVEDEAGHPVAHPLALRSSSVSLIARATGYVVMEESVVRWNPGDRVRVHRFV